MWESRWGCPLGMGKGWNCGCSVQTVLAGDWQYKKRLAVRSQVFLRFRVSSLAVVQPTPSKIQRPNSSSPVAGAKAPSPTESHDFENILSCRTQVCDRCRRLKKKCYGTGLRCSNCLISNQQCTTERTLKRRRKPKPTRLNPIEVENIKLKLALQKLQRELELQSRLETLPCPVDVATNVKLEDNQEPGSSWCSSSSVQSPSVTVISALPLAHNRLRGDVQFIADVSRTARRQFRLHPDLITGRAPLPNEDNYNGPAIIEEYSIVDNFLQQDFAKILKEQQPHVLGYINVFFSEINTIFPIIPERDYFVSKVQEILQSISVCNFNTNVINDEHNLCIVYKAILICMFYIQDPVLKSRYFKTTKHLLSQFEFLDPLNTLKCYLLTHLYAQINGNKALVVRMNGLMSSLALNMRLHEATNDPLKQELWYVCYCFDFFVTDPVYNDSGSETTEQIRMINDHSIFTTMGAIRPLLQIIEIKRKVYDNVADVRTGIDLLLTIDELSSKLLLHRSKASREDLDLNLSFESAFIMLYYLETLTVLQRSLISDWNVKAISQSTVSMKQLKTLMLFIEKFVTIWHFNLKKYNYIPLISLSKLFQSGLFINWYVSQDFTYSQDSPKQFPNIDAIKSTSLKRTQSVPGSMAAHSRKSGYKYLIMVMEILHIYSATDDTVKKYQGVLRSVFFQTDFTDPSTGIALKRNQENESSQTKMADMKPYGASVMHRTAGEFQGKNREVHKAKSISSSSIRELERTLTSTQSIANHNDANERNHYSLLNNSSNSSSVPNFKCINSNTMRRDDLIKSSSSGSNFDALSTREHSLLTQPRKGSLPNDHLSSTSVEEQLNNFVSGFRFDDRATKATENTQSRSMRVIKKNVDDQNPVSESLNQTGGDIFHSIEELVESKRDNDIYNLNF